MQRRREFLCGCLTIIAISLMACGSSELLSTAAADEPIKIGVSVPLTGPAATYGTELRNVIMFANEKLTGNRYQLVFEDDQCSPKESVNVAHKFVDVEQIKYVTGFACTGSTLAAAPIYTQAQTLVVAALPSSPDISKKGIFRLRQSDTEALKKAAEIFQEKYKSLGILAEETDYGQVAKATLVQFLANAPIKVYSEDFFSDTHDFASVMLRLKAKKVDALFILAQTEASGAKVVKQLREMHITVPIYGSNALVSSTFTKLAGAQAEGVMVISLPPLESALTTEGKELYTEYVKQYGPVTSVPYVFYLGFETFRALQMAIESKMDPKQYLHEHQFNGIFGPYGFDQNGDITGGPTPTVMEIRNSKLVEVINP